MQVNATLIAAQQAAREAQARFQSTHLPPKPSAAGQMEEAGFAAAMDDDIFKPLALKQSAAPRSAAAANPAPASPMPNGRPGSLLDIKI